VTTFILIKETEVGSEAEAQEKADALIKAASSWAQELHNEVLVFDQGFWQKNRELWQNVQKAEWEDVILEKEKKEAIIEDILGFFDAQDKYEEYQVPWKRGVIFYGPPGVSDSTSPTSRIVLTKF
jgi:transitional endoplasmic reticulum ATPase